MKIKQIRRTAPELYLVTYQTRCLKREVERWVIVEPERKKVQKAPLGVGFKYEVTSVFYFRDNDELAHDCWHQIEWMIRNDVEFFDNTKGPDPDWMWPDKSNVPNIRNIPPIPPVRNIPDFRNTKPIHKDTQGVFALEEWESREPRVFITPATTDQYDIDEAQKSIREITFEFAHQNGRREHINELQPLIDAVRDLYEKADHDSVSTITQKIFDEFDKLFPLEKP